MLSFQLDSESFGTSKTLNAHKNLCVSITLYTCNMYSFLAILHDYVMLQCRCSYIAAITPAEKKWLHCFRLGRGFGYAICRCLALLFYSKPPKGRLHDHSAKQQHIVITKIFTTVDLTQMKRRLEVV